MTDRHASGLRVAIVTELGLPIRARGLADWLRAAAPARARGLVTIALVSDDTMRRMNRRYLGKNRPTDVLSFPAFAPAEGRPGRGASAGRGAGAPTPGGARAKAADRVLGDLAIATGVARRQSGDRGHPYADELRALALHGLLHLLGYDHDSDEGEMARLEARLLRRSGLPAGVIGRAGPA
jgi:probable rRNA maturation factor